MNCGVFLTVEARKNFIINALFYSVVIFLVFVTLKLITGPLLPFFLAAALSVSLQGSLRKWVKRFNLRKKPASVAVIMAIYLTVGVALGWLIYALYRQLSDLTVNLPRYFEGISTVFDKISSWVGGVFGQLSDSGTLENVTDEAVKTVTEKGTAFLAGIAADFAKGIPGFLLSLAVMVIAGAYFVKDYDDISRFIVKSVSKPTAERLIFIKDVILKRVTELLKGYLIIISLTFFELSVGLWFLGVKYALIIAFITALIDILPVLGSGTVLIPWAVISALSGNVTLALGLTVLYLIITAIRNVIEPKIIGKRLGVHPLLMLLALVLGLRLFGAVGVLIAPFAVIIIISLLQLEKQTSIC